MSQLITSCSDPRTWPGGEGQWREVPLILAATFHFTVGAGGGPGPAASGVLMMHHGRRLTLAPEGWGRCTPHPASTLPPWASTGPNEMQKREFSDFCRLTRRWQRIASHPPRLSSVGILADSQGERLAGRVVVTVGALVHENRAREPREREGGAGRDLRPLVLPEILRQWRCTEKWMSLVRLRA